MRKIIFTIVLGALLGIPISTSFAQESVLDSLNAKLEMAKTQEQTIQLLVEIGSKYEQTNPDTLIEIIQRALGLAEELGDVESIIKVKDRLARGYIRSGSYSQAFELLNENLDFLKTQNAPDFELLHANTLRGLGNIYFIQFKQEEALEFYKEALQIYQELDNTDLLIALYDNMAGAYLELEQNDEAKQYYLKALNMNLELGREFEAAKVYINLGILYNHIGQRDSATYFAGEALRIAEENNAMIMKTYAVRTLGAVAYQEERFDDAINFYQQSLEIANDLDIIYEQKDSHLNISKVYAAMGDYENAYEHYVLHKSYNDTLLNEESDIRLDELRAQYETEKKEQQIALLEKESQVKSSRTLAISSGLGSILLIVLFSSIWFASKKRKEIELLEKDNIISESRKKLAEEELSVVRLREENLQKELTNYALHIVEKNDFLEEVKSEMADLRTDIKSTEAIKQINKLGNKIYQNLMLNKDREEFDIQVEQACTGFFKKLETEHPQLTNQERRLAALLRLNLSSKEISGILNISPKSVDQSRYRLRKKLDLNKDINLANYLNQI